MDLKALAKAVTLATTLAQTKEKHPNYKKTVDLMDEYSANITGENIAKYLKRFTPREDTKMFAQRVQLTNSINPAISSSLMKPFYKVSRNNNVAKKYDFKNDKVNDAVKIMLNDFNGQKVDDTDGFENWLKTRFIELSFADPNGFVVLEWDAVDAQDTIKPRPFEVNSNEVLNYEYKGEELQWLFVCNKIKFFAQDINGNVTAKDGEKFTLYGIGHTVTLEQCDKSYREKNGIALESNQEYREFGADKVFVLTKYDTKLGFVPAFKVGYSRDLATKGKTLINPFHAAMPYFRKALKTTSELDITMTGHVFPQKLQYVRPCQGASFDKPCQDGKDPQGNICAACEGTGFKTVKSAQEALFLPMPDDPKDLIPLDQILVYKAPPIELVEFQNKYVKELEQWAHLAVYNSNMFITPDAQFAKTATEVESNMDGIYDALEPFTEKYSKVWKFVVYTCAVLAGMNEQSDDFELLHAFPPDPKLKTLSILISDLKAINESGAPSFMRDITNKDIAEIVYNGDEEALLKYRIKHLFYPYNGLSQEEIAMQLSSQYVSDNTKILYSNFEAIFTAIEKENEKFYYLPFKKQDEIVDKMVEQFKDEILKSEPMAIDFSNVTGGGAQEGGNNGGENNPNAGGNADEKKDPAQQQGNQDPINPQPQA